MGRRARLALAVLTLVGAGAMLGAGATAYASRMGHHWGGAESEAQVRERALDKSAWVLGRIDATPEQEARINAIVSALVGDLYGLRDAHREHRRQLIAELARPQVDRAALEAIRGEEMSLADAASKALVKALAEATEVLTMEQREELAATITRH
jgi:Spy/CpxP family protein refolding chaperone